MKDNFRIQRSTHFGEDSTLSVHSDMLDLDGAFLILLDDESTHRSLQIRLTVLTLHNKGSTKLQPVWYFMSSGNFDSDENRELLIQELLKVYDSIDYISSRTILHRNKSGNPFRVAQYNNSKWEVITCQNQE